MEYATRRSLIQQILSGDEIAWNEFYEQYHRLIFSIGRRWNLSEDQCHDLVQEVMFTIFQKRLTFKYRPELGKFRTFLCGITKNFILKIKAKTSELPLIDENAFNLTVENEQTIFDEEWRKCLLDSMLEDLHHTVNDTTFDAFQMYVLQEIRPEKIAKVLNISVSTVYVYKNRCLKHLKDSFELLKKNDPEFQL